MKHNSSFNSSLISSANADEASALAARSFDVMEDPKRLDGLLPPRRSALERRESFLQRKSTHDSKNSRLSFSSPNSSSSLAFSFCGSDNGSTLLSDDEESVSSQAYETDTAELPIDKDAILKIKTQQASLRVSVVPLESFHERTVRFATVTIHFHVTILGDSPSVSSGAPLALGWQRVGDAETNTVDEYEALVSGSRRVSSTALKLSPGLRQRRLQAAGVKYSDLARRIEICDNLRWQQYESIRRAAMAKTRTAPKKPNTSNKKRRGVWFIGTLFSRFFAKA